LHITEKENDIEDPWWDLALADGTQKDFEGNTIYPFVVHEWTDEGEQQYDGSQEGVEDYFSVEAMGEGWYKLTIDPSIEERECGFDIQVRGFQTDFDVNFDEDGKITSREARDSFSRDRYVSVHYLVEGLYVHDVEEGWYDSFLDAGVNPNTSVISLVKFSLDQEGKAVKEKVTDLSELQIYQFIYQEETDCEEWVEADAADYKIEKVGEDQFSLLFYVEGVYEIRVDGIESGLQVGAWQPALGFYTSSTRPQDGPFTTLLGDEISYQEGTGQSVYLLAWLDSTNPSAVDIGSVKWNVCDSDGKVLTTGDYIITEAVKDAEGNVVGYKVTNCNKDASDFRIQAICQRNGGQDGDGIEHEREEVIAEITFHGIRKEAPAKPVASPIVTSKKDTASTSNKVGNPVAKVGDQKVSGGLVFEIRNVNKKTVTVRKCNKKNATKVTIPASVKIGGTKYAVTEISKNALKNCKKLKKITIKSKKITKIGKNAFQGVNKKAVIKVPKSMLKKYKKLFKKAGFKGKVKA
ncbi:MAG: leucine-rich repeat protein, partial [Eubacteriales bacterium]|nr:leucine-rich repeat protein [Eubacteriales bacterium]